MYKVSVIIPVYNVEKYIVRCAESLFNQSLDNIQFIFVDDASFDNSIDLLKQTIERFPQRKSQTIILRHIKHMGLPTARATGISHAEAPYVAHCDSDDYVESDMYAKLYRNAIEQDSDMVTCGRIEYCEDGRVITSCDNPIPEDSLTNNLLHGRILPFVWNKLTKTEIYRRVRFPVENYLEDFVQTVQLLTYAKRISFLNDCLYFHDRHPLSVSTDTRPEVIEEKMRQCVVNCNLIHDFIVEHHQVKEKDFMYIKQAARGQLLPHIKSWNSRNQYLETFPELNYRVLFNSDFSLSYRLYHLLVLTGLHSLARLIYLCMRKPVVLR